MINRSSAIIISFIPIIIFCTPMSNGPERPVDLPHPGMKKIASAGKSFQQGWNDASASADEKPGMTSSFTYNYWLDTTEVTQKEYYEVTGKTPVPSGSAYGVGNDYPVYYVSWFDAALYCNSRSRSEGLDTVYAYSGIKALPNGAVYELTGLRYDITRDGYRLPTEAEWEFAARGGTSALPFSSLSDSAYACSYAWYGENAGGTTHIAGTRLSNSLGLYDLAGNVFEWTNDWKVYYDGLSISNSLGALQPSGEYEKVIKGGSYNYGLMNLRPSYRKATYATTLSSANEYVGFRCARGPIVSGHYIGDSYSNFSPNPVTIAASGSVLRLFLGTSVSKIVFVNVTDANRTLCYVDFSATFSYVREYLDDRNVYMPTISPDGRYVAYCSSNEGQSGSSEITVRSLDSLNSLKVKLGSNPAYIPRWWVDPVTNDTFIVFTNSAEMNGNVALWSSNKTFLQKIRGGAPEGNPVELVSDGSYHDGLSAAKRYIVTGYNRLMVKDLSTNQARQMFLSPANGKDANGSTQVCNVSISPDTGIGVRCMFLDFGYPKTSTVTGSSYGLHQYLFISTMNDSITDYVHCPDGEKSWDNTEWSNQSRFAVGCGRNSADQAHAIYIIDINYKNVQVLMTGSELQQPFLWAAHSIPIQFDSLGLYNEPLNGGYAQVCLSTKFLMFWRLFDSLEVAITGSSMAQMGIDPGKFTGGLKTYNLATACCDLPGQKNLILHYLCKHSSKLKVICSSLDPGWFGNIDADYSWKEGVGQSKGFLYDSCHSFWSDGVSQNLKEIISQVPVPKPEDTVNMGFYGVRSVNWGIDTPVCNGSITWTVADTNCQNSLATIRMLADTLRNKGVHWILINFPVSPYYKNTQAYSTWGPSWQTAHDILQSLRQIDSTNDYFHFYDANDDGNHDYNSTIDAFDEDHLSSLGAAKLSMRVDSIIHLILGY